MYLRKYLIVYFETLQMQGAHILVGQNVKLQLKTKMADRSIYIFDGHFQF